MLRYFFIILFLPVFACNPNHGGKAKALVKKRMTFTPGEWYASVKCQSDTAYSYSLYLPGFYNKGRKFPVLFFFDAHKRGKMPVGNYRGLAEKYGFILAGSNNSTNGQQSMEMDKAISTMMDDVNARFNTDPARIYTGGFSGGARVAAYVALYKRKITGVAGCAAGFPQLQKPPETGFIYIGLVGDEDFNYLEMKHLDKSLESAGIPHFLVVYPGKHDWPPKDIMKNAFLFFQFDAMRRHLQPVDSSMVEDFIVETNIYLEDAVDREDPAAQAFGLNRVIIFLSGLTDVQHYKEALHKLVQSGPYKKQLEEELKLEDLEQQYQQTLAKAMGDPGQSSWLTKEINRICDATARGADQNVIKMNKRLLNFLSLLSYMYAKNAFKGNHLVLAGKYLNIYEKVDADNPEVYYLKAVRLARLNQDERAVTELRKAAEYGFHDTGRITGSRDFLPLHNDDEFKKVLEMIARNNE